MVSLEQVKGHNDVRAIRVATLVAVIRLEELTQEFEVSTLNVKHKMGILFHHVLG